MPHIPTAPQLAFLSLTEREALFGGSAGPGKTDALLVDALAWIGHPGYDGLLVRRTYRDLALSGAIMDRARTWLDPFVSRGEIHWDGLEHRFTFPGKARLQFGYLANPGDRYRYQSAEYQFIGVDEATQFEEADYAYLMTRNRRTAVSTVPGLKMRLGSNPGGIGHDWVRRRFLPWVDEKTGRTVYPHREDGQRRIFIPARLWDNPHINAEEYAANLRELDPVTCAQLLNGDWGVRPPGEMFDRRWFALDGQFYLPRVTRWVRAWDFAGTKKRSPGHDPDWTVGVLMGLTDQADIVVSSVIRRRDAAGVIEELVLQTAALDRHVGCSTVRIEQEPGSSGKYVTEAYSRKLLGYDFEGVPATGSKSVRAVPFAQAAKAGRIHLVDAPWVADWLSEVEAFPQETLHDDQVDASSLAFQTLTASSSPAGGTVSNEPGASPYRAQRHTVRRR